MVTARYDIHCPRCNLLVASVFSSQPMPSIYHPECAEEEQFDELALEEQAERDQFERASA